MFSGVVCRSPSSIFFLQAASLCCIIRADCSAKLLLCPGSKNMCFREYIGTWCSCKTGKGASSTVGFQLNIMVNHICRNQGCKMSVLVANISEKEMSVRISSTVWISIQAVLDDVGLCCLDVIECLDCGCDIKSLFLTIYLSIYPCLSTYLSI